MPLLLIWAPSWWWVIVANVLLGASQGLTWSATVINSSTIASTSSLSIRLIGLSQEPNNAFGAYAKWLCKINQHEFNGPTAGV